MKEQEARRLLLDTVVEWTGEDPDDEAGTLGTVTEIGYRGLLIRWDDGRTGWIAFEDMTHVEIH